MEPKICKKITPAREINPQQALFISSLLLLQMYSTTGDVVYHHFLFIGHFCPSNRWGVYPSASERTEIRFLASKNYCPRDGASQKSDNTFWGNMVEHSTVSKSIKFRDINIVDSCLYRFFNELLLRNSGLTIVQSGNMQLIALLIIPFINSTNEALRHDSLTFQPLPDESLSPLRSESTVNPVLYVVKHCFDWISELTRIVLQFTWHPKRVANSFRKCQSFVFTSQILVNHL